MAPTSHLRKFVHSILGKELSDSEADVFDFETLMGVTILASIDDIKSGDKMYSNIIVCMPLPASMPCPDPFYPRIVYTVENHNESMWKKLSEKVQKKIMESEEMQIGSGAPETIHTQFQQESKVKIEDVPFK